ncbi:Uncharacterized protein HZ326_31624 [Fusarium oxysporum f. sp. albedinis]|nr:Uncharacterized protein HZ326_31624 [Fusarium oxysporum f. sp. albedinis]
MRPIAAPMCMGWRSILASKAQTAQFRVDCKSQDQSVSRGLLPPCRRWSRICNRFPFHMSLCILHNQQLHFNGPYCDYSTHDERDRRQHGERASLTQELATMQPHIYHIVSCTTEVSIDPARIAFRSPPLVSSDTSSFVREDASGSPFWGSQDSGPSRPTQQGSADGNATRFVF